MASFFKERYNRIRNYKEQDKFYKQVSKVIYLEDKYIMIKNKDNLFEFYRGEKTPLFTRPLEFALKIDDDIVEGEVEREEEMQWETGEETIIDDEKELEETMNKRDEI